MVIRIDGDACPAISLIEELAKKYDINMKIYADYTHNINSDYAEVLLVDNSSQSVDMKIISETKENDIIVTQDFGLASIVLSKKAYAIGTRGLIYTNENIDMLLYERHLNAQIRKVTKRNKGFKKRTEDDDKLLINNLEKILLCELKKKHIEK